MTDKLAKRRSQRKDQAQEAIVSGKDELNERMSKLIEFMKELKKGWNGGPSPAVGVPDKVNLTSPLPDEVVSSGEKALNELSTLLQGLRQVKTMQDNYSQVRNQRLAERTKQMEQVQASIYNTMKKIASNPLTRAWSYIVAPFGSETGKKDRLRLLSSLARIDSSIKDIEDKVLSGGQSSILDALYFSKLMYTDAKSSFFEDFRSNLNNMIVASKEEHAKLEAEIKNIVESKITPPNDTRPTVTEAKIPKTTLTKIVRLVENAGIEIKVTEKKQEIIENTVVEKPKPEKIEEPVNNLPLNDNPKFDGNTDKPNEDGFEDFDYEEFENYENKDVNNEKKIQDYVYGSYSSLMKSVNEIISSLKTKTPPAWRNTVKEIYNNINKFGLDTYNNLKNKEDYRQNYSLFIHAVGYLKAINADIDSELDAAKSNPEFVIGSTLNKDKLDSQAELFFLAHKNEYQQQVNDISSKVSQASAASRFMKRMLTHMSPRRDKHLRLDISRDFRNARKGLQGMMDDLENRHINFRSLMAKSDVFYNSIISSFDKLADLADMYNSKMRIEKSDRKQNKDRMPYDLIRETDINAIRTISKNLDTDRKNIMSLELIEKNISEAHAEIAKLSTKDNDVTDQ